MSAPKRARGDESAGAAAGGAGGPPPPPPPPEANLAVLLLSRDVGFGDEPLSLVVAFLAPRDRCRLAATYRATWRCVPAGLSASDADRVRGDHPLWQAIIDLRHGWLKETRLGMASRRGHLARVRELCDWRADIEAADKNGSTPLWWASHFGHLDIVRELLGRGANVEASQGGSTSLYGASYHGHLDIVRELLASGANVIAACNSGWTPLMSSSCSGHVEVVRAMLAAGADKHHVANNGVDTAASLAGIAYNSTPATCTAILALLAAAP